MDSSRHRQRFETPGHARFLTFSCYQRLPLLGNDRIKDALVQRLETAREEAGFELFAWVIMPEHVHLLVRPDLPAHPVPHVLRRIKEPFAREVIARWVKLDAPILSRITDVKDSRRFWQRGGGYDRNLIGQEQTHAKAEYIDANPVRRGLVTRPTDWLWSSARFHAGEIENTLVCDPTR